MVIMLFCGSLILALLPLWGGMTLWLGPFCESLVLALWGQTLGLGPLHVIGYRYESVRGWPDLHDSRSKNKDNLLRTAGN